MRGSFCATLTLALSLKGEGIAGVARNQEGSGRNCQLDNYDPTPNSILTSDF